MLQKKFHGSFNEDLEEKAPKYAIYDRKLPKNDEISELYSDLNVLKVLISVLKPFHSSS